MKPTEKPSSPVIRLKPETRRKWDDIIEEYPRLPLSEIADAMADGWKLLTPKQREQVVNPRREKRERQTA